MLLYGRDAQIATWVCQRLKLSPYPEGLYRAIGIAHQGNLVGGVVYNNFHTDAKGAPLLIEMTIASIDKHWATRHNLHELFAYPFIQLKVKRVQATCGRKAKRVRAFLLRLGFKFEGIVREAWPQGGDAAHYSLLKHECRWITREKHPFGPSASRSSGNCGGADQKQPADGPLPVRLIEPELQYAAGRPFL